MWCGVEGFIVAVVIGVVLGVLIGAIPLGFVYLCLKRFAHLSLHITHSMSLVQLQYSRFMSGNSDHTS